MPCSFVFLDLELCPCIYWHLVLVFIGVPPYWAIRWALLCPCIYWHWIFCFFLCSCVYWHYSLGVIDPLLCPCIYWHLVLVFIGVPPYWAIRWALLILCCAFVFYWHWIFWYFFVPLFLLALFVGRYWSFIVPLYLLALDLLVIIVPLYLLALDLRWAALEIATKTLAGSEAESRNKQKRSTNAISRPMLNIGSVVVVVLLVALKQRAPSAV